MASFNPAHSLYRDFEDQLQKISSSAVGPMSPEWDFRSHFAEEEERERAEEPQPDAETVFRPTAAQVEAYAPRGPKRSDPERSLATNLPTDFDDVGSTKAMEVPTPLPDASLDLHEPAARSSSGSGGVKKVSSIDGFPWEVAPPTDMDAQKAPSSGGDAEIVASLFAVDPNEAGGGGRAYEYIRKIGEGGFGEVWEARQPNLRRSVAVKRLKLDAGKRRKMDAATRAIMVESFRCEAFTTATLDHPNIVPIHDIGIDSDGRPIIAMKLVRGTPWHKMLEDDWGRLGEDEYLSKHLPILIQIGQAVAFAHSRGLIHRDIKPSQVMVGEFDEVLLMDWGLSVTVDEDALQRHKGLSILEVAPTIVTASNPAGTVAYMAPEQTLNASNKLGPWTDVYLLGATLYNVLTNKTPHQGKMPSAFSQAVTGHVVPFADSAPGRTVPDELVDLMADSMKSDFRERTLTAKDFVQRLKDFLSGASNRSHSQKVVAEIEAMLKDGRGKLSYQRYTEAISKMRHAQALWSTNPAVPEIDATLCGGFAEAAMETGDLGLAQIMVLQMPKGPARDALTTAHSQRIRQLTDTRWRRRATMAAGVVLFIVMLVSLLWINRGMAREIESLRRASVSPASR